MLSILNLTEIPTQDMIQLILRIIEVVMSESSFIGRKSELERLDSLYKKKTASLVVVKGRRRIGKSRLIAEFSQLSTCPTFWSFAGLAPEGGITAQAQRDNFARQLAFILKTPPMTFLDWSDAFEHLSLHIKPGDIILLDEISWMGADDSSFIPKLKAWWDMQTEHILLIFCGSVSTWIEKNILKSTAFFGRVNLTISLEPLSIAESTQLLRAIGMQLSHYDIYKLLSIVGGVPWYLKQFNPNATSDENIKQLAFEKSGLLVTEFDRIFNDLFDGKGATYKKILISLSDGARTLSEIRQKIEFAHSGTLSQLMEHLIVAGFVVKQPLWSFKTGKSLKQSLYRISDPYMRFYLKMIEPNTGAIAEGGFEDVPLSTIPGFDTQIGLQLETLFLQNRRLLHHKLGISPVDIVRCGPYRQSKTSTQEGCQIDYLIQTKTNNLYICEFKLKRREIGSHIIEEIQEKISRLKTPKGFSKVAVLLHLSGVSDSVLTSPHFYRIIDIADFFEEV